MAPSLAAYAIDTSSDAIVHACPLGRVKTWNRGAVEIFGLSAADAMGRDLTELVVPEHVRHIRPLDHKVQYARRLRRAPAQRADGSSFTAEFVVQSLTCALDDKHALDNVGTPIHGSVVTLRDASAMGETVRKLRVRVAQLQADMERLVALVRPPDKVEAATKAGSAEAATEASQTEASAAGAMPVAQSVRSMLSSQVQCVLATTSCDRSPATYLMAYAPSPELRTIFIATPMGARKAQQMRECPLVSLLWDNRTGNVADHAEGILVTATGEARQVLPHEAHEAVALFLARNVNMAGFLASEGVGLFSIQVGSYELVEGYGRPQQWDPRSRISAHA